MGIAPSEEVNAVYILCNIPRLYIWGKWFIKAILSEVLELVYSLTLSINSLILGENV